MAQIKSHEIKREQKKSLFLREITTIFQALSQDEKALTGVYPTKVDFSADTGICYIYFTTYITHPNDQEIFNEALSVLKLYKGSMRSAMAKRIQGRYTPNLIFLYDKAREKVRTINDLLDKVQGELRQLEQ